MPQIVIDILGSQVLHDIVGALVKIALLIGGLMGATSYLVLLERRIAAWIQDRRGPNRVGIPLTNIHIFGLGQPIADGVKFIFKEEFTPRHVDKLLYFLGPMVIFMAALVVFSVVPFGTIDLGTYDLESIYLGAIDLSAVHLAVAPGINVGMLFVFAVGGVGVYGVVLGGWASNNKYSLLGGLRSGAQIISYELPLGLGILGVILASGSLRIDSIVAQQADSGVWNVLVQPLGFLVFAVASFAEAGRLPFDLPESEQELVGGFHTEYSGIRLMMYLVGEYLHMILAAFLMVLLFFGGWHFWGMPAGREVFEGGLLVQGAYWPVAILRLVVLLAKVLAVIVFFMIARWSWPRFRFDQLMALCWKVMMPLGMVNLVVVAVWLEFGASGMPGLVQLAIAGWVVLGVSWLIVAAAAPVNSDNRPRGRKIREDAQAPEAAAR